MTVACPALEEIRCPRCVGKDGLHLLLAERLPKGLRTRRTNATVVWIQRQRVIYLCLRCCETVKYRPSRARKSP